MSNSKLQVTLLADEWKSSKGGLSTINRELAIHLAKHPNVSVTLLVPKCTEDDKIAGGNCNVRIVKAQERPGFDDPVDWLSFPPNNLSIDIIIGHGVKLGKHAQIIRESHQCKWVQVVHTAPEQLSMLKTYSDCDNAISKGNRKQWNEFRLCKIADLVVAVGPRLQEFYSRYLRRFKKDVFNLTPGIFSKLSSSELSIPVEGEMFNILLFGRGDSEDFVLKGFDIAAKAVAQLNDTSYQLVFVGAPSGNEKEVAEKLLEGGLRRKQLIVKEFLEDWEDLATELSAADLAIIPSRSEGFGLTALEALSVGLPFLVTQTSGFGKALQDALPQSTPWVIDSEESDKWTEAIKSVRKKGRKAAVAECQTLRESYGKKYIWESQCNALVEKMISLVSEAFIVYRPDEQSSKTYPEVKNTQLKDESELSSSARSPLPKHQRLTEQRLEEKNGGRREGFTAHDFETTNGRKSSYFISQKTTPEKNLSSGLERPKASGSKMESSVTAAPLQSLNEAIMASIVHRPEEQSSKTHPEVKNKQLKNESRLSSSTRSPLTEDQRLTEQRLEDISGGRREGFTARDFETTSGRKSSCFSSQGTPPEENLSSGLERPKASGSKMESSVTAAPSQSLSEAFTVYRPDEQSSKTHPEVKNAQLKDELDLSSSARSSLPGDQRLTEQRLEEKVGRKREGFTAHDFETTSRRRSSYFRSQETTPEKNISSGFERPKASGSKMESSVTAAPSQSLSEAFTGYRPDDQSSKTHPKVKNARLKNELDLSSSARSSLPGDQRLTEQRLEEKVGRKREGFTAHDFETISRRRSSYFRSQETTPEKNISPGFERPKGISGNDGTETEEFPALSFEEQLKDLTSLISFFEECSVQTCEFIDNMKEKFSDSLKIDLMTDKERECLQSYASKKSTLLVVGQTNSGKSSFVNELLGRSFMPASEVPCTSRIVRLKYSEKNYLQVLDKSKPSEGKKILLDKNKLPKEKIWLDDSQRGDQSWVNAMVEVGLNNSLLQNVNLEVIDAPGRSEYEALDKIVEECIHGILQVIIYVIDGNSSLRLQERGFLLNLKEKVGNLPIFYLCNKVDKDMTALEFDKDSDSEEDKDPPNEEEKELLAYRALSQCYMVPGDIEPTQCPFFHGLSTKEVRQARLNKHSNQYTKQFDDLKFKLLKFVAAGVTSHLRSAAELLCQIQKRVFDFFLNCDFNQETIHAQDELFNKLELKERDYVVKMRGYVLQNLYKLSKIVKDGVKCNRLEIVSDVAQMQFDSIKIGDVVGRNEVVEQCRRQIKDLVLYKATNISLIRIQHTISVITDDLRTSLEGSLSEVGKKDDHLATLVRKQLQYSFLQHFETQDVCPHFDYALMKSGVRLMDNAKKAVIDVWSAISGRGTYLNENWKRSIAEDVLDNVDCDAIARRICDRMLEDLENGHELFQVNLAYMKQFCQAALELSDVQKKFAAAQSPHFSRLMSEASALSQTLAFDVPLRAVVGAQIGRKGDRGKVFKDKTDKERVVKQLTVTAHPSEMRDEHLLGITRTLGRIQDDISTILRPISLRLDGSNRVSVLFPKMATDLFESLQSHPILLPQGLRITQQMADAVENCWDRRIYHVDLRITNILLDFHGNAKLNVSKPRDDTIPYPDNQAPFHVPAQNPFVSASDLVSLNTLQDHCVYSLAVLLLLLVEEKYCRPPYAQTVKVDEVYAAVARGEDCEYVSGINDPEGRSSGDRKKAREIVLSIFDFQRKHNEHLLSMMDSFKSKVTEVVSSCEIPRQFETTL